MKVGNGVDWDVVRSVGAKVDRGYNGVIDIDVGGEVLSVNIEGF